MSSLELSVYIRISCCQKSLVVGMVLIITSIYCSSSYDWNLGQGFHLVLGVSNIWSLATICIEG